MEHTEMSRLRLIVRCLRFWLGFPPAVLASAPQSPPAPATPPRRQRSDDEAVVVTLRKPAKTVVVGNADDRGRTVVDPRTSSCRQGLCTTNVVALDDAGKQILNSMVTVSDRPGVRITLQRGPAKSTLACTTVPLRSGANPGDDVVPSSGPTTTRSTSARVLSLKSAEAVISVCRVATRAPAANLP